MTNYLHVQCLTNRYWDPETKDWGGTITTGTLIEISTQSDEGNNDRIIPVGIVVLEDGTFEAVPTKFINIYTTPNQ